MILVAMILIPKRFVVQCDDVAEEGEFCLAERYLLCLQADAMAHDSGARGR